MHGHTKDKNDSTKDIYLANTLFKYLNLKGDRACVFKQAIKNKRLHTIIINYSNWIKAVSFVTSKYVILK
jgi:hypothetical protein